MFFRAQPNSFRPRPVPLACFIPTRTLIIFDGLYYNLQTAGEFVLAKETNGRTFQVQARLSAPVGASSYSVITGLGIQVGGDVVTIGSTRAQAVWVDGAPITFTDGWFTLAHGLITQIRQGYVVTLDTGE
jgi:hypothetical protein